MRNHEILRRVVSITIAATDLALSVSAADTKSPPAAQPAADKKAPEAFSIHQPDVMTETKHYGMHRHFTAAGSVLLFGGGIKRGHVYGKTAGERPCTTIENPVPVEDLHATIYHALGIAPTQFFVAEKRPVYVTKDGKGKVIQDLYA